MGNVKAYDGKYDTRICRDIEIAKNTIIHRTIGLEAKNRVVNYYVIAIPLIWQ